MHYNIVHNRNIGTEEEPKFIVFEEPEWMLTDTQAVGDLAETYAGIGFDVGTIEALDGSPLVVLYKEHHGWRVIQLRQ